MGSLMASIVLDKAEMELVGAVARRADVAGTDLADYLSDERARGIAICPDISSAAAAANADVVLLARGSFLSEELPSIEEAFSSGLNVVSIAEEMAFPATVDADASARLDELACRHGVSVVGTGINPGFILDVLIICLTGISRRVDSIYAERVNDLSPYGPTVMRTQGIGLTPDEFARELKTGSVVGHIGFQQSIAMVAEALGMELDEIREERQPIIASNERKGRSITIAPGLVAGCRHTAIASWRGEKRIELVHPQQVQPEIEGVRTSDHIIIRGEPNMDLRVEPEIPGGIGTAAIAVNVAPFVVAASPGLKSMADLPVPRMAAIKKA